jgi:hypothetical protein
MNIKVHSIIFGSRLFNLLYSDSLVLQLTYQNHNDNRCRCEDEFLLHIYGVLLLQKRSVTTYHTTWYRNPEDHSVNLYHHETFRFYI